MLKKHLAIAAVFIIILTDITSLRSTAQNEQLDVRPLNHYQQIYEEAYLTPKQKKACFILSLNNNQTTEKTFAKKSIENFEILRGDHNQKYNLLSRTTHTETSFGYIELAKKLISPFYNIEKLKKEQGIVRTIVENEELFEQLDTMVKEFKEVEPIIISFFKKEIEKKEDEDEYDIEKIEDEIDEEEEEKSEKERDYRRILKSYKISNYITRPLFLLSKESKKKIEEWLSDLDKMPLLLETIPYLYALENMVIFVGGVAYSSHVAMAARNVVQGNYDAAIQNFTHTGQPSDGIFSFLNNARKIALNLSSPLFTLLITEGAVKFSKRLYQSILQTHSDFISVGTFINKTLKKTDSLIREETSFHSSIPELYNITKIALNLDEKSKDLKKLLSLFNSSTCKGDPSVLFSLKGRMIAIYTLLELEKTNLIPMFSAIGKLDAYLSLAKLYKKSKNTSAEYCFTEYKKSHRPFIEAKSFWNPFINPEIVVTNDISIGTFYKGRCCVFTGPNAGGKSTSMKAITINIIMSQTCGIAPSSHLEMTPFSHIDSHLPKSTEDIASKKSRYVGEAMRVKEILDTLETLPKDELFFIIVDELFTSTNSDSGGSIARAIGQVVARNFKNCVCIIASHLSDITELEKDTLGAFKNYRVTVEKKITEENGQQQIEIVYPYTLEEGVVDQSIAIDILVKLGFDENIIKISQILYDEKQENRKNSLLSRNLLDQL